MIILFESGSKLFEFLDTLKITRSRVLSQQLPNHFVLSPISSIGLSLVCFAVTINDRQMFWCTCCSILVDK